MKLRQDEPEDVIPEGSYLYRLIIVSTHLKGWDYSAEGFYCVTICTQDRLSFFVETVNGNLVLSPIGEIVAEAWQKTAHIRPHVTLDALVIMPNYIHGMTVIPGLVETPRRVVSILNPAWKPNSPGSIVNQIKSIGTQRIRKMGYQEFGWRSRFYDRLLPDHTPLLKAWQYNLENPL